MSNRKSKSEITSVSYVSEIYLFADDAKLFKHILSDSDQEMLQKGVDELYKWTIEWLLNLNISKCKVISFGRNADKTHRPMYKISNNDTDVPIELVDTIKRDLGILIDEKLLLRPTVLSGKDGDTK